MMNCSELGISGLEPHWPSTLSQSHLFAAKACCLPNPAANYGVSYTSADVSNKDSRLSWSKHGTYRQEL
jgi:hypothetical protein